tara:strand:+ start:213 stop:611 length:399 start_codon:yes stop_codon:yes gene_type:complete
MLNAAQQNKLEQKVGPLELLPPALVEELIRAFLKSLEIERKQKSIDKKYAYPITGATSKGRYGAILQGNELRQQDKKHYQHPSPKMARYSSDKAAHYGLLPGIVCSCYRVETAAIPCPYVPDIVVGPLGDYE